MLSQIKEKAELVIGNYKSDFIPERSTTDYILILRQIHMKKIGSLIEKFTYSS